MEINRDPQLINVQKQTVKCSALNGMPIWYPLLPRLRDHCERGAGKILSSCTYEPTILIIACTRYVQTQARWGPSMDAGNEPEALLKIY